MAEDPNTIDVTQTDDASKDAEPSEEGSKELRALRKFVSKQKERKKGASSSNLLQIAKSERLLNVYEAWQRLLRLQSAAEAYLAASRKEWKAVQAGRGQDVDLTGADWSDHIGCFLMVYPATRAKLLQLHIVDI